MEGWINDSSLSKIELALRHAMRAGISGPFPFKPTAMTLPEMNNRKGLLNINSRKAPFPFLSALFYLSQGKQTISHPEHWLISKVFCHIEVIHRETKNLQIWEWLWQPSGHREIMKQLPLPRFLLLEFFRFQVNMLFLKLLYIVCLNFTASS